MNSDDTTREYMEQVKFGIEVESFLSGKVGSYLIDRAHREIDEAVEELKRVDATDASLVQHIQNRIWRAESIDKWLAEKVQEGWNAEEHLRSQEV
jgi:hypothetical protein